MVNEANGYAGNSSHRHNIKRLLLVRSVTKYPNMRLIFILYSLRLFIHAPNVMSRMMYYATLEHNFILGCPFFKMLN